jgi:hypothetical protein
MPAVGPVSDGDLLALATPAVDGIIIASVTMHTPAARIILPFRVPCVSEDRKPVKVGVLITTPLALTIKKRGQS